MKDEGTILIVDDVPADLELLVDPLAATAQPARPGILRFWLNRQCEASSCWQWSREFFEDGSTELGLLPPHRRAALAHHKLNTVESHGRGGSFARRFLTRNWAR